MAITLSATNQVPLTKPIRFHLHDTFDPDVCPPDKVTAKQAILEIETYGSFTVGVEADEGATRLEYDLAKIRGASRDFIEG